MSIVKHQQQQQHRATGPGVNAPNSIPSSMAIAHVAPGSGAMAKANGGGANGGDGGANGAVMGYIPTQHVVAPPTRAQFGGAAMIRAMLSLPWDEFDDRFSRQFKGAASNWMLHPEGFKWPETESDPLMDNPYVRITGEWRKAFTDYYRVSIQVMNRRSICVKSKTNPSENEWVAGFEDFVLDRYPLVVKRASIGPNPGYIFQSITDDGMPVSSAPGHEDPWTQEGRRRYNMAHQFAVEARVIRFIQASIAAFIVKQGEKCVIPQVQRDITHYKHSPTKAFLYLNEHAEKYMPFIEFPPTRSQVGSVWQDDPNSSSPNMPEFQAQTQMTKSEDNASVLPEVRKNALAAIGYTNHKPMCAAHAHKFFGMLGGEVYKPLPVRRVEMRVNDKGVPELTYVPMDEDDMIVLFRQNAVVLERVRLTMKLKKPNPKKPNLWYSNAAELESVSYVGTVAEAGFKVKGYVASRSEAPGAHTVVMDDLTASVLREMAAYTPGESVAEGVKRCIESAPDLPAEALDAMVEEHQASKALTAATAALEAAEKNPAQAHLLSSIRGDVTKWQRALEDARKKVAAAAAVTSSAAAELAPPPGDEIDDTAPAVDAATGAITTACTVTEMHTEDEAAAEAAADADAPAEGAAEAAAEEAEQGSSGDDPKEPVAAAAAEAEAEAEAAEAPPEAAAAPVAADDEDDDEVVPPVKLAPVAKPQRGAKHQQQQQQQHHEKPDAAAPATPPKAAKRARQQ